MKQKSHHHSHKVVALCAALVVLAALLLLLVTRAAGEGVGIEPENGSRAGNATVGNQNGVSYVQFNATVPNVGNPVAGKKLFVDPNNSAKQQANQWRGSRPGDAAQMDKLGALPTSFWVTFDGQVNGVPDWLQKTRGQGAITSIVMYNLPKRDCGLYSAGGSANEGTYRALIDKLAGYIGSQQTIVILEPDGLPQIDCLSGDDQAARYRMMNYAVDKLRTTAAVIYIDAGNNGWIPADIMIGRLRNAGIAKTQGFALNTSNFRANGEAIAFGNTISAATDGKHFVIDTSRNGNGAYNNPVQPAYNWCNPPGRALGHYPTTTTNVAGVDAFLYVKGAGSSDGADPDYNKCHGGPPAGQWWPDYALGLIQRWPAAFQPPK